MKPNTRFSRRARVAVAASGVGAAVATLLAVAAPTAVAAPAAWAGDGSRIHTTYCQTIRYGGYVTLSERGVMTPGGGGLVCYTGKGTATVDHRWTTRIVTGTHFGALRYRDKPGRPVVVYRFRPGQTENFRRPVMVESLTINS